MAALRGTCWLLCRAAVARLDGATSGRDATPAPALGSLLRARDSASTGLKSMAHLADRRIGPILSSGRRISPTVRPQHSDVALEHAVVAGAADQSGVGAFDHRSVAT